MKRCEKHKLALEEVKQHTSYASTIFTDLTLKFLQNRKRLQSLWALLEDGTVHLLFLVPSSSRFLLLVRRGAFVVV